MKNKIQLLQFVAILIFSFGSYAQVTVSVSNLQYTNNGQSTISVANCGNINLASSTTTSINFGINLSKPNGQVVGLSDLRVYTKKSSSDSRIERSWGQISESSWNTLVQPNTRSTSASFSINSADFNASGGTLYVVFKSSGNIEYQTTCSFTITKALIPSFTLSPASLILACGDTAAKTFTVSASNIPNGANLSYGWGYTGWNYISGTSNSITLSPVSGALLPANVMVFPTVNGVAYPSKTCTVTRAPFTSAAVISGANAICVIGASVIYTINAGLGNTVAWSSSNTSIATLSSATNSQVTVTRQAPGDFILNATITNLCNETVNIPPRIIAGGVPQINSFTFGNDALIPACFSSSCLTTGLQASVINASFSGMSASEIMDNSNWEWERNNDLIFLNSVADRTQICPIAIGSSNFKVRAKNGCGWSDWVDYQVFDITECPFNFRTSETIYTIYPNPAIDLVTIELKDSKIKPEKEAIVSGTLFDLMGQSKRKVDIKNNSASLSVAGLKKGIYVLHINIDGKVEGHQVIVE